MSYKYDTFSNNHFWVSLSLGNELLTVDIFEYLVFIVSLFVTSSLYYPYSLIFYSSCFTAACSHKALIEDIKTVV